VELPPGAGAGLAGDHVDDRALDGDLARRVALLALLDALDLAGAARAAVARVPAHGEEPGAGAISPAVVVAAALYAGVIPAAPEAATVADAAPLAPRGAVGLVRRLDFDKRTVRLNVIRVAGRIDQVMHVGRLPAVVAAGARVGRPRERGP